MTRKSMLGMLLIAAMVMLLSGCGKETAEKGKKDEEKQEEEKQGEKKQDHVPVNYKFRKFLCVGDRMQLDSSGLYEFDEEGRLIHYMEDVPQDKAYQLTFEDKYTYDDRGRVTECYSRITPDRDRAVINGESTALGGGSWLYRFTYYEGTDIIIICRDEITGDTGRTSAVVWENEIAFDGVVVGQTVICNGTKSVIAEYDENERKTTWYLQEYFIPSDDQSEHCEIYYDERGRVIRRNGCRAWDFIQKSEKTTEFTYEGDSKFCKESRTYSTESGWEGELLGTTRYDAMGREVFRDSYDSPGDIRNGVEEHIEWTTDPSLPGETVKIVKRYVKTDGTLVLTDESRYRKELASDPDLMRYFYDPEPFGYDVFRESGRFYTYAEYYHVSMTNGSETILLETAFSEEGIPKQKSFADQDAGGVWTVIEYDEHGNELSKSVMGDDGKLTLQTMCEYIYR